MTAETVENPTPVPAQMKPYKVTLEAGKEYYWCTCGESKNQPFCDGSHRAEKKFTPKKVVVNETKEYLLCGCKYTQNELGFCDGTHRKEDSFRKYNEFLLRSNGALKAEKKQLEEQLAATERKGKFAIISVVILAVGLGVRYFQLSKQ